jgi:hypothetical protein
MMAAPAPSHRGTSGGGDDEHGGVVKLACPKAVPTASCRFTLTSMKELNLQNCESRWESVLSEHDSDAPQAKRPGGVLSSVLTLALTEPGLRAGLGLLKS